MPFSENIFALNNTETTRQIILCVSDRLTSLALQPAMCDGTSRASWTYFPQGPLNVPQILHCVHNRRTHNYPTYTFNKDRRGTSASAVKPHDNLLA